MPTGTVKTPPDFEALSHSEPNVQAKVLGVLLGDDYRSRFLPRFLARAGLDISTNWASNDSQAVFFTRPLRAYLRELTAAVENAELAQTEINSFLGLPPAFKLRRNTNGKLTHPRGWHSKFILQMLDDNRDVLTGTDRNLVESKLWLMEEVANTEVDLILQADSTIIFCEVKWLSDFGGPSKKPALKEYDLTQMARQFLSGLYLEQTANCTVHHLTLTREFDGQRRQSMPAERLERLVPVVAASFTVYHTTWQDVYKVAEECLPAEHSLLAYMRTKRAHRGEQTIPLW